MNRSYAFPTLLLVCLLVVNFIFTYGTSASAQAIPFIQAGGPEGTTQLPLTTMNRAFVPADAGDLRGSVPPNDNCADAEVVDLEAGMSVTRFGDNTDATNEFGYGNSVYEAFTITECMDVTVSYCGTEPAFGGAFTFLFVNCPLTNLVFLGDPYISATACGDCNFTLAFPQLTPGTYYFGVLQSDLPDGPCSTPMTGAYQLTFEAEACTQATPANDDCAGAITLVPAASCNLVNVDVMGSTVSGGSLPAIGCINPAGDASDDVWFQFVATATEHTVIVQPSDRYYAVVDVRTGNCATSTSIACTSEAPGSWLDEHEVLATGLTIGQTYFVRVFDWFSGVPASTTFDICVLGPAVVSCDANAGTLTALSGQVELEDEQALLVASPNGDSLVPDGYETLFVLTQGPELVIRNVAAAPSFTVNAIGSYTIHTLVYDPTTLDLSIVVPGTTTGFDVNALLEQGGGSICGSLDVSGAPIEVVDFVSIGEVAAHTWTVFPNPGDGNITLRNAGPSAMVNIEVLDMTGRLVHTEQRHVTQGQLVHLLLGGKLASGSYLLRTSNAFGRVGTHIVVQ